MTTFITKNINIRKSNMGISRLVYIDTLFITLCSLLLLRDLKGCTSQLRYTKLSLLLIANSGCIVWTKFIKNPKRYSSIE